MAIKMKVKLRTCEVCGVKKNVVEFSQGKVCNKCQPQALRQNTDDKVVSPMEMVIAKELPNDEIQRLHAKMDHLNQRFDRMEALVLGLMDLLGKINCDMEMKNVEKDE